MNKQIEALKKLHNSIHGQYYLGQDEEKKLIDAIYKQALAEAALNEMQTNAEELGLTYCKHGSDDACKECYMEQAEKQEPKCSEHPDAPHGFCRDASHSAGRYVCECEFWEEPKEQEPVAIVMEDSYGYGASLYKRLPLGTPLYTHPATWQSLSDDEIEDIWNRNWDVGYKSCARAIEKLLKERNHPCK